QWFCHSGCGRGGDILSLERKLTSSDFKTARDEVFRTVGRSGSLDDANVKMTSKWRRVAEYVYRDESGAPLFGVVGHGRGEGAERKKTFHLERYEDGEWRSGLGDTRRVPYRLPEIIKADLVLICEGEKDANTLAEWGLVATTSPLGAGQW